MEVRGENSRSSTPSQNIRLELDNKALRMKNNNLTKTNAELQKENAKLMKQFTLLKEENLELGSKYNNLKNIISVMDSTTKACLPKLNEIVESFAGIIKLCSVAENISNYNAVSSPNKDVRTQAVKPQIVNGNVLHIPTITLSRLCDGNHSDTLRRSNQSLNDVAKPSTSNDSSDRSSRRFLRQHTVADISSNGTMRSSPYRSNENGPSTSYQHAEDMSSSDTEQDIEDDENIMSRASRGSHRKKSSSNFNMTVLQIEDFDGNDENQLVEENDEDKSEERLSTIQEIEEEEESTRILDMFQEVRINLKQLPLNSVEQYLNSISVSPPNRRSSFIHHRSSSVAGEASESILEQMNYSEIFQERSNYNNNSNQTSSELRLNLKSPTTDGSSNMEQGSCESVSTIQNLEMPSASTLIHSEANSLQEESLLELGLMRIHQHKTSTPIVQRKSHLTENCESPNLSKSNSLAFKNITKRKTVTEKRKVAQVLLKRLSIEKSAMGDMINIKKSSDLRIQHKNKIEAKSPNRKYVDSSNSDEENIDKKSKGKRKVKTKGDRKDSPTKRVGDTIFGSKANISPQKSPRGRPQRAAKPKNLREPSLTKKMRRNI